MTKAKFEIGKNYIDNYGTEYTVISRTAKFVTVYSVEMYSERRCKVTEDSEGNEKAKVGNYSGAPILKAVADSDNKVEEINPSEYAVSVDAQEVAINAEFEIAEEIKAIDNAIKDVEYYIANDERQIAEIRDAMHKDEVHFNALLAEDDCSIGSLIGVAKTIKARIAHVAELQNDIEAQAKRLDALKADRANYTADVEIEEKIFTVETQNGETYGLPDGDIAIHGNKIFDLLNHELARFKTAEETKKAAEELEKAFERGDKEFSFAVEFENTPETPDNDNNVRNIGNVRNVGNVDNDNNVNNVNSLKEKILANADKLKAKLAEQKSRPPKRIIYWDADDFHGVNFSDVSNLQKDFKKFLKLGEMALAENVFNTIKQKFRKSA